MTLLINKDFVCQGIQVTIALPESYDSKKAYPVVFLNDGQLEYLGKIADSVILVGLEPQNRLDDFTPWQAQALRPGSPDFGGKLASYHDHLFGNIFKVSYRSFDWMKLAWLTEATRWVVWLLFPVFIAVMRCLLSFPFVAPSGIQIL